MAEAAGKPGVLPRLDPLIIHSSAATQFSPALPYSALLVI
jgi:hypothetical protein